MPKDLTDVSQWEDAVEVPVDTDPADGASVEVGFQALADRTRFLLDRLAMIFALNFFKEPDGAFFSGDTLGATCHFADSASIRICAYYFDGSGNINEIVSDQGRGVPSGATASKGWRAPASNPIIASAVAFTAMDADANDADGQRCIVALGSSKGQVRTKNGFAAGAWSQPTGVSSFHWSCIGCDRDTAGDAGTNGKWLIGEDNGGAAAPVVYASTDACASFASVAGFPTLAVSEEIRFIGHTTDPDNPSWLILTDTRALVSADGVTWSDQAHGFGFTPSRKAAAYSRSSQRWIVPGNSSDVFYSDDNGENWTQITSAWPAFAGFATRIKCDGYGTFVAMDNSRDYLFVSVDEGLTWTVVDLPDFAAGWDTSELEVGLSETNPGTFPTFFVVMINDDGAPLLETFRSLLK